MDHPLGFTEELGSAGLQRVDEIAFGAGIELQQAPGTHEGRQRDRAHPHAASRQEFAAAARRIG